MATNTKPTKPTTNLDFSSVFATNGTSTPFTWLLADYLKGWDSIENTPPSRQQFNALQEHSDKKENFLFQQYLEGYVDKFLDYLDTIKAPLNSPTFTGDPKAPTQSADDNDTSIATTEFVHAAIAAAMASGGGDDGEGGGGSGNLGGNGWAKIGNELIVQWGGATLNSTASQELYYPISFTERTYVLVANAVSTSSGGTDVVEVTGGTTSGAVVVLSNAQTGAVETGSIVWIAIGK